MGLKKVYCETSGETQHSLSRPRGAWNCRVSKKIDMSTELKADALFGFFFSSFMVCYSFSFIICLLFILSFFLLWFWDLHSRKVDHAEARIFSSFLKRWKTAELEGQWTAQTLEIVKARKQKSPCVLSLKIQNKAKQTYNCILARNLKVLFIGQNIFSTTP